MEVRCPIDEQYAPQIPAFLQPPSSLIAREYFDELISTRQCHGRLAVKNNGDFGKGVYAESDFGEEDLIFKDQMLVGAQHSSNKIDCLVCSFCYCFIGSVELQIGRKLYLQNLGRSMGNDSDGTVSSDGEHGCFMVNHDDLGGCDSSSLRDKIPLPEGVVDSLMNAARLLPYSNLFPLPTPVQCFGGCGETYYCSKKCSEADWDSFHYLLCTGERSGSVSREALSKFVQHANETNDIFLVAAKAIASTILRYRKLKAKYLQEQRSRPTSDVTDVSTVSLLLEAWRPLSMGHKRRWWDCIALPDDVDPSDEEAFRNQIKELAFTSLQLLKAAIYDRECEILFSLEIYGHIIGMFEQNNLDLVVASPIEDYFLYIDDLPDLEKKEAEKITQPILDALGDDYSGYCQGTAFFPLQSCINHSCCPNAKAFKREEDRDGQATLIALRPICKGEEVTISYIDEDLPFRERQALLADYGFRCRCPKCKSEEL